jgi:hypothetical protein
MPRKIIIRECTSCSYIRHRGSFGSIMYKPFCEKINRDLPFTVSVQQGNNVVATPTGIIPDWCPLEEDK